MVNLSISLPEKMKDYVDAQVEAGEYVDGADFVRALIRRDQERRLQELRQIVDEARAGGLSNMTMNDVRAEAKRLAKERGYL
jgi:antitoxin ParD1/3/4